MPRKPIDYGKTHFYKIVCNDVQNTNKYVGHTTDFVRRKYEHKSCCGNMKSKMYHYKLYKTIRENGGWCNWSMILIDTLHCENSLDAKKKEREFMEELQATLNEQYPHRPRKEYYDTNKEVFKQKHHEYYENNKDKCKERTKAYGEKHKEYLKQKSKEYYETNKDDILYKNSLYRENNKDVIKETKKKAYERDRDKLLEQSKEYYRNNIEKKKEYDRNYRANNKERKRENDRLYREINKEKIKAQKYEQFDCPCGGRYTKCHQREHERSNKHQHYIQSLNN